MCTSCTTEKFAAYSGTPAVPLPCPFRKQSACSQSTRRPSACSFLNPTLAHPVDCLTLANIRVAQRNESLRYGTVCSIIGVPEDWNKGVWSTPDKVAARVFNSPYSNGG